MNPQLNTQYMLPGTKTSDKSWSPLPQKIGPYQVTKLLNKGGMSFLYLGMHNLQEIVIKVLSPKLISNQDIYSQFLKEAEIIALANHPNVVRLLGQGTWEKGLYIAMEFVRGTSLRQFMQKGELPHELKVNILLQVSYALCHLHTHGIVHRDLKPENILITEQGDVKVIDFGIAQLEWERGNKEQGGLIGTPTYMSPEQRKNPSQATYASDIYSLGVLACELFGGEAKQGKVDLERIPKALRPVLEKALQPQIEKRYPDIVDWISAFKSYSNESKKIAPQIPLWAPEKTIKNQLVTIHLPDAYDEGMYLDFFELEKRACVIVYARPIDLKDSAYTPFLAGMIKMAIELETSKLPFQALPFMTKIRKVVMKEKRMPPFLIAILSIDTHQNQFSFLASSEVELWKIENGNRELFTTPNPPLASRQSSSSLLETGGTLQSGSELHLSHQSLIVKIQI